MTKNRKGFTLIEAIIVALIILILAIPLIGFGFLVPVVINGNCWFEQGAVLRAIQVDNPQTELIAQTETHFTDPSVIKVKNKDGTKDTYLLKSNIRFEYKLTKVSRPPTEGPVIPGSIAVEKPTN